MFYEIIQISFVKLWLEKIHVFIYIYFLEYLLHNQFLNSELGYTISISIWLSNSYPQMSMKTVKIKQKS